MNKHEATPRSSIDTAKSRIHVLVMRLKPVAERRTQHAGSRTRRAAFHDEMLSIEEVGGVSAVERKRLESRKRPKYCGRPFPTIPDIPSTPNPLRPCGYAFTGAGSHCANRSFPSCAVGASLPQGYSLRVHPPHHRPHDATAPLSAVLSRPARIGRCFRMADVHGPVRAEWSFVKHGAIHPFPSCLTQKTGDEISPAALPLPIAVTP